MSKTLVFDFDGTLYPFRPYDSEDLLLILAAGKDPEQLAFAHQITEKDQKGQLTLSEMIEAEKKLIIGKSQELIQRDVQMITPSKDFLKPLKKLISLDFKFELVTCGITNIAENYLENQGIRSFFGQIYGKRLVVENGIITDVLPADFGKKETVLKLMSGSSDEFYAVGDGFTDLEVFSVVDRAVFIDLGDSPFAKGRDYSKYGYPIVHSIEELVSHMSSVSSSQR